MLSAIDFGTANGTQMVHGLTHHHFIHNAVSVCLGNSTGSGAVGPVELHTCRFRESQSSTPERASDDLPAAFAQRSELDSGVCLAAS